MDNFPETNPESAEQTDDTSPVVSRYEETPQKIPEEKKAGGIFSFFFELAIILLVVWAIRSFIATPFQIEGSSMRDTLYDQEKIFVSRIPTYLGKIERGDIIVFKPPSYKLIPKSGPLCLLKQKLFSQESDLGKLCGEEPQQYVKRVIGVGGDTVEIKGGKVFLTASDGIQKELSEPYLNAENRDHTCFERVSCSAERDRTGEIFTVPEGHVFVLGDNRVHSSDSRSAFESGSAFSNGSAEPFVPLQNITGEAKIIIWPPARWQIF